MQVNVVSFCCFFRTSLARQEVQENQKIPQKVNKTHIHTSKARKSDKVLEHSSLELCGGPEENLDIVRFLWPCHGRVMKEEALKAL